MKNRLPSDPHAARVYGFVAREARKAVLLRRGPSKQVRLLSWDLETDRIEPGQWLKGRIYERRCDLSPDGTLFVYFAAKHRGPVASWTAVCRPPMLTALSFFPKDDCWGGGGLFPDGRTLQLNHRIPDPDDNGSSGGKKSRVRKQPRYMRETIIKPWEQDGGEGLPGNRSDGRLPRNTLNLEILPLGDHSGRGEDSPIEDMRLRRDGWAFPDMGSKFAENRHAKPGECSWVSEPPIERWKPAGDGSIRLIVRLHGIHESQGRWYVETMAIAGPTGSPREFGRIDWADTDHNGDVLYTADGRLYRLVARAHQGVISGNAKLIADLNRMKFQPVARAITPPPAL